MRTEGRNIPGAMEDPAASGVVTAPPRGIPGDDGGTVALEIVSDFDSGRVTAGEWNALVGTTDAPVYLTFEWQSTWWKFFGNRRQLRILLFRVDGQLVGIAPFHAGRGNFPGRVILGLLGSGEAFSRSGGLFLDDGPSDYLDVLIDPRFGGAVGEAIAGYLFRNRDTIERLDMVNLRPESSALRFLVPALVKRGFAAEATPGDQCPFVPVTAPVDEFISRLSPGVRRRLNQALRLLDDTTLTFRENDGESLEQSMEDLMRLHQRRWNAMGFPGLFFDAAGTRFQKAVARRFSSLGWLWHATLYEKGEKGEDGECVAARLGFNFQGRAYEYLSGFDATARLARKRPGLALWLAMYRGAHANGTRTLDLLRGDEKYKFELTDRSELLTNVSVPVGDFGRFDRMCLLRAGSFVRLVGYLAVRERQLLRVQAAQHPFPKSVAGYVRFRADRFFRKVTKATGREHTGHQ